MDSPPTSPSSPLKVSVVVISEIDAALNTSGDVSDAVHTEQQPPTEIVAGANVEQSVDGQNSVEGVSTEPLPTANETLEEQIGSAGKVINDVVASVEAEFGSNPIDDGANRQESEEFHDSLDLSETQSQSVDGAGPVTQEEDVPAQLATEEERIAEKVRRAKERRQKALEDGKAEGVSGCIPTPEAPVHVADPVDNIPLTKLKQREAIRKLKQSHLVTPRRSPRLLDTASPGEGSTRKSPRVLATQKASPSLAKAAPISRLKKTVEKANDPTVKGNQGAAKGKKSVGQVKQGVAGKSPSKAKKVVRFKKD